MIAVRLREAMERHRRRTGKRITYRDLAALTGLSTSTLQAISARPAYNTTLETVDLLCQALDCSVGDLLERMPERPQAEKLSRPRRPLGRP